MAETKPIVICAIAKNEHLYINDWVKHHIDLGFDHIYIFDNDNKNSLFVGGCIDDNYKSFVTFFDMRGIKMRDLQVKCYNDFYNQHNDEFSWCAFIDLDEYIILRDWRDIKSFLNRKEIDGWLEVRLKWHLYGDDDYLIRDVSVSPLLFFQHVIIDNRYSNQGKAIVRGGLNGRTQVFDHLTVIDNKLGEFACLPSGAPCRSLYRITEPYDDSAYVNHYMTKTLDEFLNQKLYRGDAIFDKRILDMDYYWRINRITPEKINYVQTWFARRINK